MEVVASIPHHESLFDSVVAMGSKRCLKLGAVTSSPFSYQESNPGVPFYEDRYDTDQTCGSSPEGDHKAGICYDAVPWIRAWRETWVFWLSL